MKKRGAGESKTRRPFLGLTRRRRIRIYGWSAVALVLGFVVWALLYLRPDRWYTYTDQVAFEQVARDVELGHVVWEPSAPESEELGGADILHPAVSADGARMVHASRTEDGNADLFLRRWNGTKWSEPRRMRALNSSFNETSPALSGDGRFLYFASDRPGGRGGSDIWVATWDGAEFAWPLPLTARVNTPFDETDPALSPDELILYFASNRPHQLVGLGADDAKNTLATAPGQREEVQRLKTDFDLYAADVAADTPFDLIVERRLSMLYSLREGALSDPEVMAKLGGSAQTEQAVSNGLAFLARTQEADGRWNIARHGGQARHDVAATACALLAFYGRGERHDQQCQYRQTVSRGLEWLLAQQDVATGDLRGMNPAHNAMYDHGIASLALVEAYGVTKDSTLRPPARAAIEFIAESQHPAGGWRYVPGQAGDLSVSGWMIMALESARMSGIPVPEEAVAGAVKFLDSVRGGSHGGSYGYTNSPGKRNSGRDGMNAAGFFCSQLMGSSPNNARAFESSAILGRTGCKPGDLYYAYYGTLAAYQYQGPLWKKWMKRMQDAFIQSQAKDGSWNLRGQHASAMGKVVGTALVVLCLEAHYRYTPLYGLGFEPSADGPVADTLNQEELPPTPFFRHAKHLPAFRSPGDDTAPVVTQHGDFLYFASTRDGGFGGADIYRARISGPSPDPPENVGAEINTSADESHPAVRMAGFHLLFNSTRDGKADRLFSSHSRRLMRRYNYARLPSLGWFFRNLPVFGILLIAIAALAWCTRRAIAAVRARRSPRPPAPPDGAVT